jgi:hypothetical protein
MTARMRRWVRDSAGGHLLQYARAGYVGWVEHITFKKAWLHTIKGAMLCSPAGLRRRPCGGAVCACGPLRGNQRTSSHPTHHPPAPCFTHSQAPPGVSYYRKPFEFLSLGLMAYIGAPPRRPPQHFLHCVFLEGFGDAKGCRHRQCRAMLPSKDRAAASVGAIPSPSVHSA